MSYLDPDPHVPMDTCDCHNCAIHERNTLRTRTETLESVIRAILNSVPFGVMHAALARRARQAIAESERSGG